MTRTLLLFLPVVGALVLHAPVLRFDLFRSFKRPIDGGRCFRGRRIFGDNKTWRGALVMCSGCLVATVLLWHLQSYRAALPPAVQAAGPFGLGLPLGLGVVLGELPNSFLKRQAGIAPGARKRSVLGIVLSIYDQGDFVPVVWAMLAPIWVIPVREIVIAFVVLVVGHAVINVIGFAIGARKTAI